MPNLNERERLLLLMAIAHLAICSPHVADEVRAIADKFGGLRGWELVEKQIQFEEMGNERCVG